MSLHAIIHVLLHVLKYIIIIHNNTYYYNNNYNYNYTFQTSPWDISLFVYFCAATNLKFAFCFVGNIWDGCNLYPLITGVTALFHVTVVFILRPE